MKKKLWLLGLAAVVLLAVLVVPIPISPARDGGTQEYAALTYKIVRWNRESPAGVYDETKVYWLPDNFKSLDQLWAREERNLAEKFVATVVELNGTTALVQPMVWEDELRSSDRIAVDTAQLEDIGVQVGSLVEISYIGGIMETYPAQIRAVKWIPATELRQMPYTEQWLDPEKAETVSGSFSSHMTITAIYENCFFAQSVIPLPYLTAKFNGKLPDTWCVGDKVLVEYGDYRVGDMKMETEFRSVSPSDFEPNPYMAYKPVIYLYPTRETEISVKLQLNGALTCTYPAYENGWKVTATPDGTLTDSAGQTYNYLYWEGQTHARWDMTKGFCVKGEDTAAFLEQALEKLGLDRREANEFIVFWLPLMQENPYNIISFQADRYREAARLQVSPVPDTVIRVFMTWQAADSFVDIPPQELTAPERTGFTLVEWGGTEVN